MRGFYLQYSTSFILNVWYFAPVARVQIMPFEDDYGINLLKQ